MRKEKTAIWLPEIINKITLFTFLSSLAVLLLFVAGNFQGFIDSTQIFLLRMFRFTGLTYMVTGIYNLFIDTAVLFKNGRIYSKRVILTVIGEALMFIIFMGVSIILTINKG